jgi:hypothetical protein
LEEVVDQVAHAPVLVRDVHALVLVAEDEITISKGSEKRPNFET